jgi:hypothetical protein
MLSSIVPSSELISLFLLVDAISSVPLSSVDVDQTNRARVPLHYVYQEFPSYVTSVSASPTLLLERQIIEVPVRSHQPGSITVRTIEQQRSHPRLSVDIDGVPLTYDSKLSANDRSIDICRYFIDGRLLLIKGRRYNIVERIA